MLKKSFVSIAFSSKKLQVLQLNSSKKKVVKFATIDLPAGLIARHKVQDKIELATLLKNVWKKLGIKEKAVGIVVPEFSTFIKLLNLPVLEAQELGEAVEWQAHDFLPKKVEDMSMDWKIVQNLEDTYQVLAVALEREILEGYVNAAGEAGLFPMVVETPSLSLVRIGDKNLPGRLVIYEYFDETILIIANKRDIIGSSVVATKDVGEVVKTAVKIIKHYKTTKVEGILVGGIGLDAQLPKTLGDTLKLPVGRLKKNMGGLSEVDIQAYLIPISLQLKEPTEPSDEKTINLLPRVIVEKYRSRRSQVQTWTLMMVVTFMVWSSFLAAIGTYVYLTQQISSHERQNSANLNVISKTEEAIGRIKEANANSNMVLKILGATIHPQAILNEINRVKPEGISITSYKMELDRGEVGLKGTAVTRTDLLEFKQKLEEIETFSNVEIPISNFEVESNLRFNLDFNTSTTKTN